MYLTAPFKYLLLLALAILLLATRSVIAGTAEDFHLVKGETLPEGFEYVPLRISGSIGDVHLNHTGTIEEILAKVADENPGFKIEDVLTSAGPAVDTLNTLDKRTKSDLACYPFSGQPTWKPVEARYIRDGISYLQKVTALCWVEGHKCSRISCSYKSAISLCNVTPVRKGLSCSYMASYAQDILNKCTYEVGIMRFVGGQAWDTQGYNINVYRDTSC
ncbi:hypothetical protein DL98DRAFT_569920 [Cadophora sp. DSE1049]|nr:hypothetical protein DL98DRAFT_569920 [Cadophora sp. DSE1049]